MNYLQMSQEWEEEYQEEKTNFLQRLEHCPECKKNGVISSVEKALQEEGGKCWVYCTGDECNFLEEYYGGPLVTEEELVQFSLPGQLAKHMEIYFDDIGKITRLCLSEYIQIKYLKSPSFDFEGIEESASNIAASHNLKDFVQPSESSNFGEQGMIPKQGLAEITTGSNLAGCSQLSQSMTDEYLGNSSQNLDDSSPPLQDKKSELTLKKKNELYRAVRRIRKVLVEDLPVDYQEKIKAVFSKLDGYNFPEDFIKNNSSEKSPVFMFIKEIFEQQRINKDELFLDELDSFFDSICQ